MSETITKIRVCCVRTKDYDRHLYIVVVKKKKLNNVNIVSRVITSASEPIRKLDKSLLTAVEEEASMPGKRQRSHSLLCMLQPL